MDCLYLCCSSAEPKIADYAFTTVVPNIGIVHMREDISEPSPVDEKGDDSAYRMSSGRYDATHRFSLLDVPGLLPGAHSGVGLGNAFLRHIQKCRSPTLSFSLHYVCVYVYMIYILRYLHPYCMHMYVAEF